MALAEAARWRAVKMPRFNEASATRKPTADASSGAGNVTDPKDALFGFRSRLAPVPRKRLASVMEITIRSPARTEEAASSGSSTPVTVDRLTWITASPKTTSPMLRPTTPPIWKVGSTAVRATAAEASGLEASVTRSLPCFQSKTWVPTDTRLRDNVRPVPIIFTAGTPCNWALPKEEVRPVYFRTVARSP